MAIPPANQGRITKSGFVRVSASSREVKNTNGQRQKRAFRVEPAVW
jgi:hypothetical protein